MKRIILPGTGSPTTFCMEQDSTIGVRAGGKMITLKLKANEPTRVEFAQSLHVMNLRNIA